MPSFVEQQGAASPGLVRMMTMKSNSMEPQLLDRKAQELSDIQDDLRMLPSFGSNEINQLVAGLAPQEREEVPGRTLINQ